MIFLNAIKEWINVWFFEQNIDNPWEGNQWGIFHILTLVFIALIAVGIWLLYKYSKNKEKYKKTVLITLASLIALLEVLIRIQYFTRLYYFKDPAVGHMDPFWIMMPKPWCAVACWLLIASPIVNKKFFYNFSCITAMLCSLVFFAYPGVGYNNVHNLFGNMYSIVTHALLLITSISLITLRFTEFKYENIWKVGVSFAATFIYGPIEIFIFKFEGHSDPMYFMPGGDIQADILGIPYGLYIAIYILFIVIFINAFYGITLLITKKKNQTTSSN